MDIYFRLIHFLLFMCTVRGTRWHQWWEYEGLSGPEYWGLVNPDWALCTHGKQQSPIDIEPSRLLFDPNLKHLQIESTTMKGSVTNTGSDITVDLQEDGYSCVNISLGPLSYNYRAAQIKFHFANVDSLGSEHRVAGKSFPVEMHIIAYNLDLYANLTAAMKGVKGIVIIAVFLEIGKETNKPFYAITKELRRLHDKGSRAMVHHIELEQLLPKTDHYITYDGSLTQPGCYETVTWIIYNKPAVISREQLTALRVLYQRRMNLAEVAGRDLGEIAPPAAGGLGGGGERASGASAAVVVGGPALAGAGAETEAGSEEEEGGAPVTTVEVNARPIMPLNHRVVRTNINTRKRSRLCTMEREMYYQVNEIYLKT